MARRWTSLAVVIVLFAPCRVAWAQAAGPLAAPSLLTLAAAVVEALERSPDLQPREDAVRLAGISARLAAADFRLRIAPNVSATSDPVMGASRNLGLSVSRKLTTGGQVFANLTSFEYGPEGEHQRDTGYTVGVSQPLLRGFRQVATAALASATRQLEATARERDAARALIVVRTTQLYFEVLKQERLKAAAEKAAARAAALEAASQARTRVGLATELDVLRARILAAQSTAAVIATDSALAAARDQLARGLGRDLDRPFVLESSPAPFPDEAVDALSNLDALVAQALVSREDVVEARARAADAARASRVARWNSLPPVAVEASYTQRGLGATEGGLNSILGGWRFGLTTSYSADRTVELAAVSQADIAEHAAVRGAHDAEQRVALEVRQAYRAWRAALTTLDIQRSTRTLAERELELASLRYSRGLGSSLDVVGAEANVLQAENALIAAELDLRVLALDLRRVAGALDARGFGR